MKPTILTVRAMEYGSYVDIQTDTGIYRYWVDREAALYIRKMREYCPGKMLNFAKNSCIKWEKFNEPEKEPYVPLRLNFIRKFDKPVDAVKYVMDSFMLGVERLVVRGVNVYEMDRIKNK